MTDINNGNRNRFATAAIFGPLDPIVAFFHSHDVIYLCNCYFPVESRFLFGQNEHVVKTAFMRPLVTVGTPRSSMQTQGPSKGSTEAQSISPQTTKGLDFR